MGQAALVLDGVTKRYPDFTLDRVSFQVPRGSIVGLIGENGAGKSTTIHAILGLVRTDGGTVALLGEGELDAARRDQIGVVFDGSNYPELLTPRQLGRVFARLYPSWDGEIYRRLLDRFQLPAGKKLKQFSKGMKRKYAIAVAMSHRAQLLILDEATSGLDPIVREEILDLFLDFMQEEEHAILVSSHITSDLEKVADYIVFLHEGKVIFSKPKDELTEQYGILQCGASFLDGFDREDALALRKQDYAYQILVADRRAMQKKYPGALIVPATIDDIMLLYVKGEVR